MTNKIYCVDCSKFKTGEYGDKFGRCLDDRAREQPVTERFISPELDKPPEHNYASSTRNYDEKCGPDAKWFEAK